MVPAAMAALWALAAYGGDNAAYDADNSGDSGDDNSDGGSYGRGAFGNSYSYGDAADQCNDELAAGQCKFCTDYGEMTALPCVEFADDGECDASCNSANCSWDGMDCFHDDK